MPAKAAGAALPSKVVVIGAGFVGVSVASCVRRALSLRGADECEVAVLDASPVDTGQVIQGKASWGNAGTIAAYASIPIPRPGLWRDALRSLAGGSAGNGPLQVSSYAALASMMPWCIGALESCDAMTRLRTTMALGTLLQHTDACWEEVREDLRIEIDAVENGYLLLQDDAMSPEALATAKLRQESLGGQLQVEILDQSGVLQLEPALSDSTTIGGAHFFPDGWSVRNPGQLLDAMTSAFAQMPNTSVVHGTGGRVTRIERQRDSLKTGNISDSDCRKSIVRTADGGCIADVDIVVIAAGAHSAELASQVSCGDALPLSTERGYHVEFDFKCKHENGVVSPLLTRSVCNSAGGFIVSPMRSSSGRHVMRAAGLVELGGTSAGPVDARYEQLERSTRSMFREEAFEPREEREREREGGDGGGRAAAGGRWRRDPTRDWLGFRPTLPDWLPVIGRSSANPTGVLYAFGHQHIGLTLAAVTGKVVANLAVGPYPCPSGKENDSDSLAAMGIDLAPFSPQRFQGRWWWGQ